MRQFIAFLCRSQFWDARLFFSCALFFLFFFLVFLQGFSVAYLGASDYITENVNVCQAAMAAGSHQIKQTTASSPGHAVNGDGAMEQWSNGADVALAMAMALTVCELCANLNKFEVCFCLRSLLVRTSRNICEHLLSSPSSSLYLPQGTQCQEVPALSFLIEFFSII